MKRAEQSRYNPRHSGKTTYSMLFCPPARLSSPARVFIFLILAASALPLAAQVPPQSAQEFADKIVAHVQSRSAVTLTTKNISSLSSAAAADAQRIIESQLRARGVRLVEADRAVEEIRITFSENARGYLWIAEIGHGDSWEVVMLPVAGTGVGQASSQLVLRRVSLISQAEPILDVDGDERSGLLVLSADRLTLYAMQNGRWTPGATAAITHQRPFPRDLRGRVVLSRDGSYIARLPGILCSGATQPQLTANCQETDDPWPLNFDPPMSGFFNAARNYFTGALVPAQEAKLPPFYAAAALVQPAGVTWLFSGVDGVTRLVGSMGLVGSIPNWGSDLTVLRSNCGSGTQAIASRATDFNSLDALQAYEFANGQPSEAGAPLEFAGPITALWPVASDSTRAVAVARNLKTGMYEAFSISIACSR